jgi:ribonuclease D
MKYKYIDEQNDLDALIDEWGSNQPIAVDTEANSLYNYFERVCLIQLTSKKSHVLIDPLSELQMSKFTHWLAKKEIILHGADFDLRMLRYDYGFKPQKPIFDTMLAAQLLGMEHIGLAALIKNYFDVDLEKQGQKSNWGYRPLSNEQLEYAVNDTLYLPTLCEKMKTELSHLNRLEWHEEWCERIVVNSSIDQEKDTENAWRIKGITGLNQRQLAFVRAIWHWREKEAQKSDKPPFKVLGNKQIVDWATNFESHGVKLLNDKKFNMPRNITGTRLDSLQRAVSSASKLPKADWPRLKRGGSERSNNGSDYKPQLEKLRKASADIAKKLKLAPSVVAPKASLAAAARTLSITKEALRKNTPMMNWQIDLLQPVIKEVLK